MLEIFIYKNDLSYWAESDEPLPPVGSRTPRSDPLTQNFSRIAATPKSQKSSFTYFSTPSFILRAHF